MGVSWKQIVGGSLIGSLSLTLVGCLGIYSQDPSKIFADGKWPAILRKMNGQLHELRDRESIVSRTKADQQRDDLLRIAVIDNGVDYTHPDLVSAIAFDLKEGDITGAGFDVLGRDNTPSPQVLDPALFAFGAKDVIDGKIIGPPANPLDLILAINKDFETTLAAKIQGNPILAKSLFTKALNGSLNVVGGHVLLKTMKDRGLVDASSDKVKPPPMEEGLLPHRPGRPPSLKKDGPLRNQVKSEEHLVAWLEAAQLPWVLQPEEGLPFGVDLLAIEQVEVFAQALKDTLSEVESRTQYQDKLNLLIKFTRAWNGADASETAVLEKLARALAFKKFGPNIGDPVRELKLNLRSAMVAELVQQNPNQDWNRFSLSPQKVGVALEAIIGAYENNLRELQNKPDLGMSQRVSIKSELEALPQIKVLKDWYLSSRGWENETLDSFMGESNQGWLYRKLLYRSNHPFLAEDSATISHGTHVAGIIAKQDPRIRIYPVRVLTQGVKLPEGEKKKLTEHFQKVFSEWLQNPLVFKASSKLMAPIADLIGNERLKQSDALAFAEELLKVMDDVIVEDIDRKLTNYLFVEEVIQAIKKVGQEKIRIANVSLGTEFKAPVVNPAEADPEKLLKDTYQFLLFEYFKFQIGAAIQSDATKTVFVIANGNSGKWVDGRSQSALPVDLSSPFLKEFERPQEGLVAPNNQITNVIGVGSLAVDGKLSSFTNLIISKKTPFVMAEGESVLSPVRQLDASGISGITDSHLPKLKSLGRTSFPMNSKFSDADESAKFMASYSKIRDQQAVLKRLVAAVTQQMVLEHTDHRALMSGTSMASPTVAGLMGRHWIEEMVRAGRSPEAKGPSDDFDPSQLIQKTLAVAEPMEGDLYIPLRKLTGQIRPERSSSVRSLIDNLEKLKAGDASGFQKPQKAGRCRESLSSPGDLKSKAG